MPPLASAQAVGAPHEAEPADMREPRRRWRLLTGAVVAALLVLGLWRYADRAPSGPTAADVDRAVKAGIETLQQQQRNTPPDATIAYRAISPSLVTVTTENATSAGEAASPRGLGAGVVINAEGAVLTALHVVDGDRPIQVRFADGTTASARVVSRQADTDVAVLAVDRLPQVVVPAVIAGTPVIGDDVFAVGNPLGLQASLTAGVVSASDRSVRTQDGPTLEGLIQFDAAVNPGSSGGPLLNRAGQVVGIVTGLANPAKLSYFVGIGFAVPIATAAGGAGGPQQ